jgi:thioredoxin reductase
LTHGVHNFIGLDGLLPTEIRKIVWKQIDSYNSTEFRKERVVNVNRENGAFIITNDNETSITAKKIILARWY